MPESALARVRSVADRSAFTFDAVVLAVFGGLALIVLWPPLDANWLGTGALCGGVYWTLAYHEGFTRLRERLPDVDRGSTILGMFLIAGVLELLGNQPTLQGNLVAGFVGGFVVSGLVHSLQTRLVADR